VVAAEVVLKNVRKWAMPNVMQQRSHLQREFLLPTDLEVIAEIVVEEGDGLIRKVPYA
jgi:hypothetical protein